MRGFAGLGRRFGSALTALLRGVVGVLAEALRIVREMLVIPAQLWLAIAEPAGAAVYAVWRRLIVPVALTVTSLALRALRWAQAHVTPARAAVVVAVGAGVALAASQFVDYRGISVGTPAYAGVEAVAPAPEVGRENTGTAHAWVMLPIAVAALIVIVLAARGRWRLARLLIPLGLLVIVVGIVVDVPAGLDEGDTATAYEGAEAVLLEGFWAQLAAGAVLIVSGPLLAARLRPERAGATKGRRARWRRRGSEDAELRSSPMAQPPIQGTTS